MKKYLFIGGPVDGERKSANGDRKATIRIPEQFQWSVTEATRMAPHAAFWHYTLRKWPCGNKFIPVYVLEGLTDIEAMKKLFKGYKP